MTKQIEKSFFLTIILIINLVFSVFLTRLVFPIGISFLLFVIYLFDVICIFRSLSLLDILSQAKYESKNPITYRIKELIISTIAYLPSIINSLYLFNLILGMLFEGFRPVVINPVSVESPIPMILFVIFSILNFGILLISKHKFDMIGFIFNYKYKMS